MEHWENLSLENIVEYIDDKIGWVTEEWKPIKGYEGNYEISSFGRVKSLYRVIKRTFNNITINEKILKQGILRKRGGYLVVAIRSKEKPMKSYFVHRLVGQHFLDNPKNKKTINHKEGNVKDNRVYKIEWNTYKENTRHAMDVLKRPYGAHSAPAGPDHHSCKRVYCITNNTHYFSTHDAAEKLGCTQSLVSRVCNGLRKRTKGYSFKFVKNDDKA